VIRYVGARALAGLAARPMSAFAQECKDRGDFDPLRCDDNGERVADSPGDPKKLKRPTTPVSTATPAQDPAVYEKGFKPFTDELAPCTGKRVVLHRVQSEAAEIEAMRPRRLRDGGYSTGPTAFAVSIAGAVPWAIKGGEKDFPGDNLTVVENKDSALRKLTDPKGRKFAHTSPSSDCGHVAPLARFAKEAPRADKDSRIIFSGKHDPLVTGVNSGACGAAAVASDVFRRLAGRGQAKEERFRINDQSANFLTSSVAGTRGLAPAFRNRTVKCLCDRRHPDEMKKAFDGAGRFFPINDAEHRVVVRQVAEAVGEKFNSAAYEKQCRRGEEARKNAIEERKT